MNNRQPVRFLRAIAAASCLGLMGLVSGRATAAEVAGYWPQWRGPERTDISKETGLLADWPKDGPKLLWEAKGLGGGYSSVSVVKGKIFVMGEDTSTAYLYALDAGDGHKLWSRELGKAGGGGGYPGPRGTPAVDGDLVYATGQFGDLVCCSVSDGSETWHVNLKSDLGGDLPGWGYAQSPLIDGDHVICSPGGKKGSVAALDKKTGKVVWRSTELTEPAHYSSPVAVDIEGVHQIVQLTSESVSGIAADTGKLLWHAPRKGQTAVIPTPIVSGNLVYVTSGYGIGDNLFKVEKSGDSFSVAPVYSNKVIVNHHGGVILYEGHLYGFSDKGGWTCQDLASGDTVWQEKSTLGKGAIAYADKRFYLRGEGDPGTIVLIEATTAGFKEHGRFNPPDISKLKHWPHLVITGGRMYVRDQNVLLCYDVTAH